MSTAEERLARELEAKDYQLRELEAVLRRNGFRPCDIPACNCGSWHPGPNQRAEKAEEQLALLRDAARATVLFHSGGPWDAEKEREWERLTLSPEATTKTLCDFQRAALGAK